METRLRMPDLGTTSEEIAIVGWLVEVGAQVERGQPIVEVETDKSTMEVESVASGTVSRFLVAEGDTARVGQELAVIETGGVVTAGATAAATPPEPATTGSTGATAGETNSGTSTVSTNSGTTGTRRGMFARNREKRRVADASAPAPIELSPSRRAAVRRLQLSKQSAPHFYLTASFNAEPISAYRDSLTPRPAWDALFVAAGARALSAFPLMGRRYEDDRLIAHGGDAIGVAVDVDGELFVPVVTEASTKSVAAISAQIRAQVVAIAAGEEAAKRLLPAAMTITNLGATRVESFAAVLNPPEASILAIGRIAPTPWVEGNAVVIQRRGSITLSVDHRVANGKYAAGFLSAIVSELESMSG